MTDTDQTTIPPANLPDYASKSVLELLMILKQRVQAIRKEGFNDQGSYNFRGIDQVVNAAGPIERELGLLVWPELVEELTEQSEYGKQRTLGFRTRVKVRYHFVHAVTGAEHVVGPIPGEAIDTGDKGTAKAMSVACRVMYLQTLTIPTDEPDPDSQSYTVAKPEASISDPTKVADLEKCIREADTRGKLQTAFAKVRDAYEGDQATITKEEGERLGALVRARLAEIEQSNTSGGTE